MGHGPCLGAKPWNVYSIVSNYCVTIINFFADIDECLLKDTLCRQVCINTDGSYFCDCMDGYQLIEGTNQCQGVCLWKVNNICKWLAGATSFNFSDNEA